MSEPKKENDIIIGYFHKEGNTITFKLRPPVHKMKSTVDKRKRIKGTACDSYPYNELVAIGKRLGLKIDNKIYIKHLCEIIKIKLMELEKGDKKYFYQFYEKQPIK